MRNNDMPKFYVTSGDLRVLLVSDSAQQAVIDTLRTNYDHPALSSFVKVSEMGFESVNDDDIMFSTELMLQEADG